MRPMRILRYDDALVEDVLQFRDMRDKENLLELAGDAPNGVHDFFPVRFVRTRYAFVKDEELHARASSVSKKLAEGDADGKVDDELFCPGERLVVTLDTVIRNLDTERFLHGLLCLGIFLHGEAELQLPVCHAVEHVVCRIFDFRDGIFDDEGRNA